MDERRREFVMGLWRQGREFDAGQADRLDRRRNLEPESGELLNVLVRAIAPESVLELGTSNGVSAIWLADAVEAVGGAVMTVEFDAARAREAAGNLERAGVAHLVEQRVADAADVLGAEQSGARQVVFLDAERPAYVSYWPDLCRVLTPGGLLVVDNCISHADQVRDFRDLVDATPGFCSTLVPVGAGVLLVVRDRDVVDGRSA